MTSNELTITANAVAQYVNIIYTSEANSILGTFFNATDGTAIKDRVEADLVTLFKTKAGANFAVGSPPPGITAVTIVEVRGNSPGTQGGEAGFELMNRFRIQSGVLIYIGTGSLDLVNHQSDPVMSTQTINERENKDRVADAIARLAAHEIGHALGLVPQSSEISGDGLAAKLNVTGLGLNGTSTHHNPTNNDVNIMQPVANLTSERTWKLNLYDFEGKEKTYLDRILP